MRVYHGIKDPLLKMAGRSIAIGIFDGVHRGHRRILRRLLADAELLGTRSMVVTFEPHPLKVLNAAQKAPILISLAHRLKFFRSMGIQEVLIVRFNRNFSRLSREQFLSEWLIRSLSMKSLAVGYDFRFGYKGMGDAAYLRERSKVLGFKLSLVGPLKDGGEVISSTRIRRLIEGGQLKRASMMLGRPVSVYGTVIRGHRRGQKMGIPTANLDPHHETLPPAGVYAAWGLLSGRRLRAAVHIGGRPTFGEKEKSIEAHFFDSELNLYGKELELLFYRRIRPIRRFKTARHLISAIRRDISHAREVLR
jgi:riboflavin kinase/FMN adenylyltransferase